MAAATGMTPCAACKLQRRKCTAECTFAPYFPPEDSARFSCVQKVFGASNVSKILAEVPPHRRSEAVYSLVYEADALLREPLHGCVGYINVLQHRLHQVLAELHSARCEMATFIGHAAAHLPISYPQHPLHRPIETIAGATNLVQFNALPASNAGCSAQAAQPGLIDNSAVMLRFTNNGQAEQKQEAVEEHEQQQYQQLNPSVMQQQWQQHFSQPLLQTASNGGNDGGMAIGTESS